jgi:putative ABC transport system permease protein
VLVSALKNEDAASGFKPSRLRDALVIAQVTLSVVAIATAGLFVRSLDNARGADPGFDPSGILDVPIYLEAAGHDVEAGARFYRDVAESLETRPEIQSATLARFVPLGGASSGSALIRRGIDEAEPRNAPSTYKNEVAPGYFEMLDIRILRGRPFTQDDGPDAPGVVILNETAAERLWSGEDPIGQRVSIDDPEGPFLEVVGIVEDTKYNSLGEGPQTFAYLPLLQRYRAQVFLHIRSTGPVGGVTTAIREVLAATDPRVAMGAVRTLDEDMSVSLIPARAGALLFGIFGLLALVIAGIGVYGVTSYVVSRRTREIGIRTAVGASRGDVLRLFLKGTLRRVGIGLVIGLGVAIAAGRLLSSVLYGVSPFDPASTVVTPTILVVVAFFATYIPARRAARVDPIVALRHE